MSVIPGIGNILNLANRAIKAQSFDYYAFEGRGTNAIGLDVAQYKPPVTINGNVQPVPRQLYQQMGLDLQKYYVTVYVSQKIIDVTRDVSGDHIIYEGRKFQCTSNTNWYEQDGWVSVLCVEVQNAG